MRRWVVSVKEVMSVPLIFNKDLIDACQTVKPLISVKLGVKYKLLLSLLLLDGLIERSEKM